MINIWSFFQDELLGMNWLNKLVGNMLTEFGLDISTRLGGALQFFIYDIIKIVTLLCTLIFTITYIQSYFPPERTKKILSSFKGIWGNIIAALLGTVTPFCSCSSIPLFIGFTGAGLPLGLTFSFLISSPMVDLGSLVLLTSIFGIKVAFIYVILGLVIAVIGGKIIEKLKMDDYIEEIARGKFTGETEGADFEIDMDQKERFSFAFSEMLETLKKVIPYILLGVGIGAFVHNWIPEDTIVSILGEKNPFSVILATLVGIPMYADIFGTIPVAEALYAKGAQLGSILSFMMAVTTLSLPSILLLRRAIKPKLLAVFVTICTLGIIISGYIFNFIEGIIVV